jgi:hypothetical protein
MASLDRSLFLFAAKFYFFPGGCNFFLSLKVKEHTRSLLARKAEYIASFPQMMKPWPDFIKSFHKSFSNK